MEMFIEISAAEGGEDSKIFVGQLAEAYERFFSSKDWKHSRLISEYHKIRIKVSGNNLSKLKNEAGGHRIQRCPPTEKRGRVHTSTVTVSVTDGLVETDPRYSQRSDDDFRVEWFSGTGKGGQKRTKSQSCWNAYGQ